MHFCITVGNECATEWNGNVKEGMIEICKEVNSASKYTEIWGGGWDGTREYFTAVGSRRTPVRVLYR